MYINIGMTLGIIGTILTVSYVFIYQFIPVLQHYIRTGSWGWEGRDRYNLLDTIYHDPFDVDVKGWLSMVVAMIVGVLTSSALAIISGIIWPATLMVAPFFVNACIKRFKVMTAAVTEEEKENG